MDLIRGEKQQSPSGGLLLLSSPQTIPMLTPETWEVVLRHLKPKDLLSATYACSQWGTLMMAELTSTLFPLVLPILMEHLDLEEILSCRGVSREAMRVVDESMKEDFAKWEGDPAVSAKMRELVGRIRARSYSFDSEESLRNFISFMDPDQDRFELSSINPFIGGSVFLLVWRSSDDDLLWILQCFLVKYGKNIRSLIFYDGRYRSRSDVGMTSFELLLWILEYLPNLRSLKISGELGMRKKIGTSVHRLENIEELCINPQLPSCQAQYGLWLMGEWKWTLKSISVGCSFLEAEVLTGFNLFNSTLCLKRFQVHGVSPIGLKKLLNVPWELEEIQILKCAFSHTDPAAIRSLLKAMLKYSTTLSTMKLLLWELDQLEDLMAADEVDLLEREMGPLWKLKTLTTGFSCLNLSWFRKFLRRSCQQLQELNLFLYEQKVKPDMEFMVTFSRRAFDVIPNLRKIKIYSEIEVKQTIFRQV